MRLAGLFFAAVLLAPPGHAAPLPRDDGFVYPGEAGAAEAAAYLGRRAAFRAAIPAQAARWSREELDLVAWMAGRWRVSFRNFEAGQAASAGSGRATVRLAPGARWLTIGIDGPPERYRLLHLGFDVRTSLWVLDEVSEPADAIDGTRYAPGWQGGRLQFGVVGDSDAGFRRERRDTIVRTGDDSFRLVSEIRMASGTFVVFDDVVFTRLR